MTEVQLRKAEEEVSRLEQELNMLKDSMNTKDACKELVDDVLKRTEPYGVEKEDGSNPWTRPPPNAACCVIV